jgi:hypothetical protein
MSPTVQSAFEEVERGLLRAIVLAGDDLLFERADDYRCQSLSWLIVKPIDGLPEVPLQIGEIDGAGNTRWSLPTAFPSTSDMEFEFFDFFDWYPYGIVDFPYVRVRVVNFPQRNNVLSFMALIEPRYCRFFLA